MTLAGSSAHYLDHRIPPPIVGLVIAIGMWLIPSFPPVLPRAGLAALSVAIFFLVIGIAVAVGGVISFRRARTTVNPLKPEATAVLVTTGVYSHTRNPMYVGMVFVLVAWSICLPTWWSWIGPALFMLYITRFQIIPEERALARLFGESFAAYRQRVRRWL